MADMGRRQPAADEPLHSFPLKATFLAPSSEDVVPEIAHGETKVCERMPVARYSEVSDGQGGDRRDVHQSIRQKIGERFP